MNKTRQTAALMIWWCEGTKARKDKRWKNAYQCPIEVTNCNPKIIKIFADFLRCDLGVDQKKLKCQVQIHEGDSQEEIESFWENAIGIPRNQFNKTIVRKVGKKVGKNRGTFKLRTYDKSLYNRLILLLDEELEAIESGSSSDG